VTPSGLQCLEQPAKRKRTAPSFRQASRPTRSRAPNCSYLHSTLRFGRTSMVGSLQRTTWPKSPRPGVLSDEPPPYSSFNEGQKVRGRPSVWKPLAVRLAQSPCHRASRLYRLQPRRVYPRRFSSLRRSTLCQRWLLMRAVTKLMAHGPLPMVGPGRHRGRVRELTASVKSFPFAGRSWRQNRLISPSPPRGITDDCSVESRFRAHVAQ